MALEVLRRLVSQTPHYQVSWTAQDGAEAVARCAADLPDLILMDVVMPIMDGVEATRRIMASTPCAILMVTASVNRYAAEVFTAMGYGALDAINTPAIGLQFASEGGKGLLKKISAIATLIGKAPRRSLLRDTPRPALVSRRSRSPLIAIGSSTGGPQALAKILSALPATLDASIVVVQHVDEQFAPGLAHWLNDQTPLTVDIAQEGQAPSPGHVSIAGTNDHLCLSPSGKFTYCAEPQTTYRPSVDALFASLAQHWPQPDIAVILTGMGQDGAQGLKLLRDAGWRTIAQDRKTSVVYGMPRAAFELGAVESVLPLEAIAPACLDHLSKIPY